WLYPFLIFLCYGNPQWLHLNPYHSNKAVVDKHQLQYQELLYYFALQVVPITSYTQILWDNGLYKSQDCSLKRQLNIVADLVFPFPEILYANLLRLYLFYEYYYSLFLQ